MRCEESLANSESCSIVAAYSSASCYDRRFCTERAAGQPGLDWPYSARIFKNSHILCQTPTAGRYLVM